MITRVPMPMAAPMARAKTVAIIETPICRLDYAQTNGAQAFQFFFRCT